MYFFLDGNWLELKQQLCSFINRISLCPGPDLEMWRFPVFLFSIICFLGVWVIVLSFLFPIFWYSSAFNISGLVSYCCTDSVDTNLLSSIETSVWKESFSLPVTWATIMRSLLSCIFYKFIYSHIYLNHFPLSSFVWLWFSELVLALCHEKQTLSILSSAMISQD